MEMVGEQVTAAVDTSASRRRTIVAAGLIVLAAAAAYHNSLAGPFIFDDPDAIARNPTIRRLWPIGPVLLPPGDGSAVDRRPVANLSVAVNYALGGTDVRGYHALNLAAHLLAALTLFGVVRRSLLLPALRGQFGAAATPLALIAAVIWTVHPLQTNAVTYIIQRTEVLAGLFYLLTLYCVIRGADGGRTSASSVEPWAVGSGRWEKESPPAARRPLTADRPPPTAHRRPPTAHRLWYAAAVVACLLAVGSKESTVSAPLLVLLYDRLFLAGSWREALRRRRGLYLGLAATWSLPVLMLARAGTALARNLVIAVPGHAHGAWLDYALVQFESLTWYLRLCFWPAPLMLDYGPGGAAGSKEIVPYAILVVMLACGTVLALRYRPALGFLGVWLFAILAPSSSVIPIASECAAEKRMYLPLAAVVLAVVGCIYSMGKRWLDRRPMITSSSCSLGRPHPRPLCRVRARGVMTGRLLGYGLAAGVVLALTLLSVRRNDDYRSAMAIWQDELQKRPNCFGAHNGLGLALADEGRTGEAIEYYRQAVRLAPGYFAAYNNLGNALARLGRSAEAIEQYEMALRLKPDYAEAHNGLGAVLAGLGRTREAMEHYQQALRFNPRYAEAHNNLGALLASAGRSGEAIEHYQQALRLNPDYAEAHNNLGSVLAGAGRSGEAIEHCRQAVRLKPDYAEAHNNLGNVLASVGRSEEAIEQFSQAIRLKPDYALAHYNLGLALATSGRSGEAIEHYQQALRLKPDSAEVHNNLGNCLIGLGKPEEALPHYAEALRLKPDLAEAHNGMAAALAGLGRTQEAIEHLQQAARLNPALAKEIQSRLESYRAGQPHGESPRP